MKPLRSYINEGIFDVDQVLDDGTLEINALAAIVYSMFEDAWKERETTEETLRKECKDGYIHREGEKLTIEVNPRVNYNYPKPLAVHKDTIRMMKENGINTLQYIYKDIVVMTEYYINFADDMDGVDCGGMTFISPVFRISSPITLNNLTLETFTNKDCNFTRVRFKRVTIRQSKAVYECCKNHEYGEIGGVKTQKLYFAQMDGDNSNLFDEVTLKSKFNISIGCTSLGMKLRDLRKDGSYDAREVMNTAKKYIKSINNVVNITFDYFNGKAGAGGAWVLSVPKKSVSEISFLSSGSDIITSRMYINSRNKIIDGIR